MLISLSVSNECGSFLVFNPYPTLLKERKITLKHPVSAKQTRLNIRRGILGFHSRFPADCQVCTGSACHACTLPEISTFARKLRSCDIPRFSCPLDDLTNFILRYFQLSFLRKLTQIMKPLANVPCLHASKPFKAFRLTVVTWAYFRP